MEREQMVKRMRYSLSDSFEIIISNLNRLPLSDHSKYVTAMEDEKTHDQQQNTNQSLTRRVVVLLTHGAALLKLVAALGGDAQLRQLLQAGAHYRK